MIGFMIYDLPAFAALRRGKRFTIDAESRVTQHALRIT
jgi:hypothetical protein